MTAHHEIMQEAQHWFHWGRKALWSALLGTNFHPVKHLTLLVPFYHIPSNVSCSWVVNRHLHRREQLLWSKMTVQYTLLHYSHVFTHLVLFPSSSYGTWKWVIIMRTAAPTPRSEIPVPTLRTTQSLQTYPCQHASDHAATATWEQSRLAVPKMTTQHPWTRAAHHLWLTPLFAPTAPALVSHCKDRWLTCCKYIYLTS